MSETKQVGIHLITEAGLTTETRILLASETFPRDCWIQSKVGTGNTLYIGGGASTTVANGFRVDAGEEVRFTLPARSEIWGISVGGIQTCYIALFPLPNGTGMVNGPMFNPFLLP